MRALGTFGIYVQTQVFDFLFIASVIAFGICLGTLISRLGAPKSMTRKIGAAAVFFAFAGGTLDALENLVSFALMQFETAIPNGLALIYSSFAALKFASLTTAMVLAVVALLTGLGTIALRLMRCETAAYLENKKAPICASRIGAFSI